MTKEKVARQEDTIEEIAVIGLAGRFPGARDIDQFWENIRNGIESITRFADQELESQGIPSEWLQDPNYVKAGTVLEDFDQFDAMFFGYSPKEAENIDPQQRIFLETAWEALEHAGRNPGTYDGPIGVFAGSNPNDYLEIFPTHSDVTDSAGALEKLIGNEKDFLCTRVSYKLNLRGPSITVQTGCSTSLAAVQLACQSLLNYQCNLALAGGVSVNLRYSRGYFYQEGMIPSPDGHCRAFDADARGTVMGQGVGVVVLKRLSEALSDGDTIHAVIKGVAINNDGALKAGYTAPSVDGQAQVIAMSHVLSGVTADTISYVETHGTGTPLGDPIEIAALTQAFRASTQKKGFCAIGSVKTNIGHADAAAGIAGLIKTVLMLKHKQIPPSLHFKRPNPNIDFENSPLYVATKLCEWQESEFPRRAGVSSFGLGGTNVHAVLQEAPAAQPSGRSRPWQLLIVSARTSNALEKTTTHLVEHLKNHPQQDLADVVYTLHTGRKAFNYRRMAVCKDRDDTVRSLESSDPGLVLNSYQEPVHRDVVFMFSGQGAQYINMGLELYKTESVFREHVDHCSGMLRSHLSLDLRDLLYPEKESGKELAQQLEQTSITQAALFTFEYALAKLWMSWGVHPSAMVGHSIGEYVAACLAEVFSLEDALFLVANRGRLMQQQPAGSMLAVQLSEEEIERLLGPRLSLAAVNAPGYCVVSGETEAIKQLESDLERSNVAFTPLHTSHAFHSKMMEPIIDAFVEQMKRVELHPPRIPYLSNLTGKWITSEEAKDPGHWARHMRQTVRFSDCIQELLKDPLKVLLEVGPGQTLTMLARQHPDGSKGRMVLSSIRHPKERKSDIAFILNTLGRLWLAGVEVDWSGFYKDERRHRLPLPTYPFERQRYWIEPAEHPRGFYASQAGLGKTEDSSKRSMGPELVSDHLAPRNAELKSTFVAPKSKAERIIAEIWQELLGIKQVSIHDNYFDLGGTSILAVRLFARIEKTLGKKVPLSTLFDAPTVGQLANIIEKGEWSGSWDSLVKIQSGDSRPPFFCVHAAGGNVLNYNDLARHLGPNQTVYGLQAQGLDGAEPFLARIEDMAAKYVDEIQTVQNKGPYMLGGYCMGGTIALEMAQQLQARGQEVALLALFDTYNWANTPSLSFTKKFRYYLEKIEFHYQNFSILPSKEKAVFFREKSRELGRRSGIWFGMAKGKFTDEDPSDHGHDLLLARLWKNNDRAALSYLPRFYPGKITLFLPIRRYSIYKGPNTTFEKLAREVEICELPLYPAGMLVEPFVEKLAKQLKARIDQSLGNTNS